MSARLLPLFIASGGAAAEGDGILYPSELPQQLSGEIQYQYDNIDIHCGFFNFGNISIGCSGVFDNTFKVSDLGIPHDPTTETSSSTYSFNTSYTNFTSVRRAYFFSDYTTGSNRALAFDTNGRLYSYSTTSSNINDIFNAPPASQNSNQISGLECANFDPTGNYVTVIKYFNDIEVFSCNNGPYDVSSLTSVAMYDSYGLWNSVRNDSNYGFSSNNQGYITGAMALSPERIVVYQTMSLNSTWQYCMYVWDTSVNQVIDLTFMNDAYMDYLVFYNTDVFMSSPLEFQGRVSGRIMLGNPSPWCIKAPAGEKWEMPTQGGGGGGGGSSLLLINSTNGFSGYGNITLEFDAALATAQYGSLANLAGDIATNLENKNGINFNIPAGTTYPFGGPPFPYADLSGTVDFFNIVNTTDAGLSWIIELQYGASYNLAPATSGSLSIGPYGGGGGGLTASEVPYWQNVEQTGPTSIDYLFWSSDGYSFADAQAMADAFNAELYGALGNSTAVFTFDYNSIGMRYEVLVDLYGGGINPGNAAANDYADPYSCFFNSVYVMSFTNLGPTTGDKPTLAFQP